MTDASPDPGTRGVGWGGAPGTADAAVYTRADPCGHRPEVRRAGHRRGGDPPDRPPPRGGRRPRAPRGHRFGEGSITADVSCRPPGSSSGVALRDEIGDAIADHGQFYTRPPWMDLPPTEAEALAGTTPMAVDDHPGQRDGRGLGGRHHGSLRDGEVRRRDAASPDARAEQRLVERGIQKVEGELDAVTLALITQTPGSTTRTTPRGSVTSPSGWAVSRCRRRSTARGRPTTTPGSDRSPRSRRTATGSAGLADVRAVRGRDAVLAAYR